MVKGINKRVVVLKPTDTEVFEEAIFLIRDEAALSGVTRAQLLREAQRVALGESRSDRESFFSRWRLALAAATGAGLTGLVWAVTALVL